MNYKVIYNEDDKNHPQNDNINNERQEVSTKLDDMNYPLRAQIFKIGYLDERNGLIRSDDVVKNMLNLICTKYGWNNESVEYGMCYIHYNNGKAFYKEQLGMYEMGLSKTSPEYIFCYSEALGVDNLDADIKKIIESYPDYDYEMTFYKQDQTENNKNKKQR